MFLSVLCLSVSLILFHCTLTSRMSYIDNDYADEIMAIEDKYGENKKKEFDMKQLAELQLQHLNGTLGPLGVPRFFNSMSFTMNQSIPPFRSPSQLSTDSSKSLSTEWKTSWSSSWFSTVASCDFSRAERTCWSSGQWSSWRSCYIQRKRRFPWTRKRIRDWPCFQWPRWRSETVRERKLTNVLQNVDHHDIEMFASLGISGTVVSCQGFPPNITSSVS